MTHTKDEALNRALEALEWMVANDDTNEGDEPVERLGGQSWNEYNAYWLDGLNKARASITAIKQALAAPAVQDPVAWWVTQMDMDRKIDSFAVTSDYDYAKSVCDLDIATPRPLIFGDTTPPTQPAPNDIELMKCWVEKPDGTIDGIASMRLALSKYGAAAQPAPEVTNLVAAIEYADARWSGVDVPIEWARHFADAIGKLYTTPPAAPVQPVAWMEMVVANLVREGVTKHKARELAEHFYTTPPAQPAVPDAITDNSESPDYRAGWNECRELTIQMRKP
jgi:hypothetical protein